jgi:hypothetical protein
MSMPKPFTSGQRDLKRSAREEREKAEDEARSRVDGRTLRKYAAAKRTRTKLLGVRVSDDHRTTLENLARALGKSFTAIIELGIELVDMQTKGR